MARDLAGRADLHLALPPGLDVRRVPRPRRPHAPGSTGYRRPALPAAVPALPVGLPLAWVLDHDARAQLLEWLGARRPDVAEGTHVVYCHAPARWLYSSDEYFRDRAAAGAGAARCSRRCGDGIAAPPVAPTATSRTRATAAERIRAAYGIEAAVVHPPVDVDRFAPRPRGERLLVVSRLLRYKRVDLVVEAASRARVSGWTSSARARASIGCRRSRARVVFHGKVLRRRASPS